MQLVEELKFSSICTARCPCTEIAFAFAPNDRSLNVPPDFLLFLCASVSPSISLSDRNYCNNSNFRVDFNFSTLDYHRIDDGGLAQLFVFVPSVSFN